MQGLETVEKVTKVTFPPRHLSCAHGLADLPQNRTLAEIEVFFAPGDAGASEGYKIPPKSETTIHSVVSDFFSASDEICPTPLK